MPDGLRCPKCYVDFDDEAAFREHYRQHLDGAPPPDAIVERARDFEGEWTASDEAWRGEE